MSRAMNLNLTRAEVEAAVLKQGASISAIEPLLPSGTRVVLTNAEHAADLRRKLKALIIDGKVKRTPLRSL